MVCRGDKFVCKEFVYTLLIVITVSGQGGLFRTIFVNITLNKIFIFNTEEGILCRSFNIDLFPPVWLSVYHF